MGGFRARRNAEPDRPGVAGGLLRGDVVVVDFDPARSGEAAKLRPAVVVSNNVLNTAAPVVVVVPLTANLSRVYPSELVLPAARTGTRSDSKAQTHLIRHVSKNRVVRVIGRVPADLMKVLDERLREVLGL